ncbi:hypothetical protein JY651_28590 [Pyxidicoccus parkwayensis]|uniref:Uncharacterized protein n=1 Tax=Pyxidicoccus parkwayensis TaxID=2813578 RepID=A0ABX7NPH4_9BACT|nr:hypothetical protein [Pyxidicoccus parkwaysis]QSQ19291.1 hypothetical protein JY651_28590 [Pyxidicoccus parkwaysis]
MFFPGWREATDMWKRLEAERDALQARLDAVGTAVQLAAEEEKLARNSLREQVRHLDEENARLQSKVLELEAALELAHAGLCDAQPREQVVTLEKARVVEALRRHVLPGEDENALEVGADVAARDIAERLGLTLDTPMPERQEVEDAERPVMGCGHVNREDGLCAHPDNLTPECHKDTCPLVPAQPEPAASPLALAPPSTEGQGVDWQAMELALRADAPADIPSREPLSPRNITDDDGGTVS